MFSWLRKLGDQLARENAIKQDDEVTEVGLPTLPDQAANESKEQLSPEESAEAQKRLAKLMRINADRVLGALAKSEVNTFQNNFQMASVLGVQKNEDGMPLCKEFDLVDDGQKVKVKVNCITDGVGGTGNSLRYVEETAEHLTEAHLGAREIQNILAYHLEHNQDFFLQDAYKISRQFNNFLLGVLKDLDTRHPIKITKHATTHNFQTTFSMAIIQEKEGSKNVQMVWAGDSPIVLITPDEIWTSVNCDKNTDILDNCLSDKWVNLSQRTFIYKPDTPMVVIACSDGMTKFRGVDSQINTLVYGVLGSLKQSKNSAEFSEKIFSFYSDMSKWEDDTTISVSTSVKDGKELESLVGGHQRIVPLGD